CRRNVARFGNDEKQRVGNDHEPAKKSLFNEARRPRRCRPKSPSLAFHSPFTFLISQHVRQFDLAAMVIVPGLPTRLAISCWRLRSRLVLVSSSPLLCPASHTRD